MMYLTTPNGCMMFIAVPPPVLDVSGVTEAFAEAMDGVVAPPPELVHPVYV